MNHKITALKTQKKNPNRINVYLDGEFAFGLTRFVAAWLQVGQEIDDDRISQLNSQDELETAYQRAIKYINYKPRTEHEVYKKLSEFGFSSEIVSTTINRLKKSGLIDDYTYASLWVDNRTMSRPKSSRFIAYELQKRGVEGAIIETALSEFDDVQIAFLLSKKKLRTIKPMDKSGIRKYLYPYLYRQGFDTHVCNEVISRILNSEDTGEFLINNEGNS